MVATNPSTEHPLLRNDMASAWLGLEVLALGDGHATVAMTLRAEMMNGFGITHGGMIFSLADSAFALACNPSDYTPSDCTPPNGAANTVTVASGADINFLGPTRAGQRLTAVANRRQQSGRSGLYDVQVFAENDDGTAVVAEFRGRSRTIPSPRTGQERSLPQ